jgi:hypothetical protein
MPRSNDTILWFNWVYITSWKYIKQDFNDFDFQKLQNTKDVTFSIYYCQGTTIEKTKKLDIPLWISQKLWEYFRNRSEIEKDEKYRLPHWLKNSPVNCKSFVYYIKWWFENMPKLEFKYIKNSDEEKKVQSGDILYRHIWDEASWEYRHYMIYIWEGFCISKNWHSTLMVTRENLVWLYRVIEK